MTIQEGTTRRLKWVAGWRARGGYEVVKTGGRYVAWCGPYRIGDMGSLLGARALCQVHHDNPHCPQCFTPLKPDNNPEVASCESCGWGGYAG